MVERLHWTLKAALMAHGDTRWSEILPTVLLGLRTAWKADLGCSSAEIVYGEPLEIPGEFCQSSNYQTISPSNLVTDLRRHMKDLKAVPASRYCKKIYIYS